MRRKRSHPRQRNRVYGVVLDGGFLAAARVEDGRAVDYTHLADRTSADALRAWLAMESPREPVTVAVLSKEEQSAGLELPKSIAEAHILNAIEAESARRFPSSRGPYSIVAQLDEHSTNGAGNIDAKVFGIPESELQELWDIAKTYDKLRFTLPSMALRTDGVHLVVYPSVAELFAVMGTRTVASAVLRGVPPDWQSASQSDWQVYAEEIATEVRLVITNWISKEILPRNTTQIHLTGPGSLNGYVNQALVRNGYKVALDLVSPLVDMQQLLMVENGRLALQAGLAAAAAVTDLGKVGVLRPPGRSGPDLVTEGRFAGDAPPKLRRAVILFAFLVVVAVGVGSVLPRVLGEHALKNAQAQASEAGRQVVSLGPDISIWNKNQRLENAVKHTVLVKWAALITRIMGTMPSGVKVSDMTLTLSGTSIDVKMVASAYPQSTLPVWMKSLQTIGVTPVVTGFSTNGSATATATTAPDTAHFTLSFSYSKSEGHS